MHTAAMMVIYYWWSLRPSVGVSESEWQFLFLSQTAVEGCLSETSVCLQGKAASGGLTSATGNTRSVFTFMRVAEGPERSPYEDFCSEANRNFH